MTQCHGSGGGGGGRGGRCGVWRARKILVDTLRKSAQHTHPGTNTKKEFK